MTSASHMYISPRVLLLASVFLFVSPLAAQDEVDGNALSRLNQDRERLLHQTIQLRDTLQGEMKLAAVRTRNRLTNRIDDLASAYSPPQFEEILTQAEPVALVFGTDFKALADYYRIALKIIGRVETLQTLRESYGVGYVGEAGRQADVEVFRQDLREKVSIAYLRFLLKDSPAEALEGFRRYTNALRELQVAEQFKSESEVMEVAANQELMNDLASGIPLLSDAVDVLGVVTGENIFTGEKLSAAQRSMDALVIMAPGALEKLLEKSADLSGALKKFLDRMENADSSALQRLVKTANRSPDELVALKDKVRQSLDAAEHRQDRLMGEMAARSLEGKLARNQQRFEAEFAEIKKSFAATAEGADANHAWKAAEQQGERKIAALDELLKTGAEQAGETSLLTAYQAVRQDKRALTQLQSGNFQALREKVQALENGLFTHVDQAGKQIAGKVDLEAMTTLKKGFAALPDADELTKLRARAPSALSPDELVQLKTAESRDYILRELRQHGYKHGAEANYASGALDFGNMDIHVFNATNKPPALGKVGFDRDITYQVAIPEKRIRLRNRETGEITIKVVPAKKIDLPASQVEEHYHTSLYRNLNPGMPLPSRGKILEFGKRMDHQVTDAQHLESYRLGLDDITRFFEKPALLLEQGVRVEDFASTVTYKSQHWFDMADQARKRGDVVGAMTASAEGMRQASKQYENYMSKLLAFQGLDAVEGLPVSLQKGMAIFQGVKDGRLTLPEAQAALKAINQTQESVVTRFGAYFESVVKLAKERGGLLPPVLATPAKRIRP